MHNITLSLAIQGKGFFRERFQHSKSGLVCTPHRNHCALLRSSRLFLFTLVLVRILLREHLGAISGLWSLLGGRLRPAQDPRARQSDLLAPRGGWEWRCWDNVYGLEKPSTWRSWAGVPQQTFRGQGHSVNSPFEQLYFALPKDSKHKLPGGILKCHYCAIPWFLFLALLPIPFHKINAFFVSWAVLETGNMPHKGNNSVHRSHPSPPSRFLTFSCA